MTAVMVLFIGHVYFILIPLFKTPKEMSIVALQKVSAGFDGVLFEGILLPFVVDRRSLFISQKYILETELVLYIAFSLTMDMHQCNQ